MGQKVNPVLFRLGVSTPNLASWYTGSDNYSQLLSQDLELKVFLCNLLKTRGILIRSLKISRSYQRLVVDLDLYFSYGLSKQAKFFWARSLFKTIKKRYTKINRIKDVKNFVSSLDLEVPVSSDKVIEKKYISTSRNRKKIFLSKVKIRNLKKKISFSYKNRLFFFLISKKDRNQKKIKEDIKLLSVLKSSNRSLYKSCKLIRLNFHKFNRLFVLKKFKYNFKSYYLKNSLSMVVRKSNVFDLLELNMNLCKSIRNYCGVEEVQLKFLSSQLNYLPSFKFFYKKILSDLLRFQKNRDLNKYFFETIENLYFVVRTFGFGNAYLLSCIIVFLLENTRKQIFIAKFIKKSLQVLFLTLPRNEIAIDGIKILIKGRFNKRRRTKKVVLQEGQISLQTISTPIDYYQTQAVTIYGTFGIKVWISKHQKS